MSLSTAFRIHGLVNLYSGVYLQNSPDTFSATAQAVRRRVPLMSLQRALNFIRIAVFSPSSSISKLSIASFIPWEDVVDIHLALGHSGLQLAVSGCFVVLIPHNEHMKVIIKELMIKGILEREMPFYVDECGYSPIMAVQDEVCLGAIQNIPASNKNTPSILASVTSFCR